MNRYKSKQEIGYFKDIKLIVDWDDLLKYGGNRYEHNDLDKKVGKYIFLLGIVILLFSLILSILNGSFSVKSIVAPNSIIFLIPYFSIPFFVYSSFLRRDKNVFDFNYERVNLKNYLNEIKSSKVKVLEVDNFLSIEVLEAIDKFYTHAQADFLLPLIKLILEDPENISILQRRLGLNVPEFYQKVISYFLEKKRDLSFDTNINEIFLKTFETAVWLQSEKIDLQVLLFVFNEYYFKDVYKLFNIVDLDLNGLKSWFRNETIKNRYYNLWKVLSHLKPKGAMNRAYTSRATPTLDRFSQDFTAIAAMGKFSVSLGKEDEMLNMLNFLQLSSGAAVLIVGDPGVGKTNFLSHLATRMVVEDVPQIIRDYRMVVVDLNRVFTDNSTIEGFKSTLQKMLDEVVISGNILLVFEEFSQILGIREEGRVEVVNLIINMISKYKLKVIATVSTDDYIRKIKAYKTLSSLFEVVKLNEPAPNIALQILVDESTRLESKYKIPIQIGAIKRIVELAPKFDYERVMPDKGVDLLEEAMVNAINSGAKYLNTDIVEQMISKKIGVSIGKISEQEAGYLKNIEEEMHKRIVGQDEAIKAVASALRRARAGVVSGNRPVASFLFYGPTGVGKTEVSKVLSSTYYGDEKLMIRLDMSEYQEEANLGRLIGYTDQDGNLLGGYLTEAVRTRPFSLVLLDEIEKANPKVLDLFLQVLDEGFMTDGLGRRIDFTNTIVIATSNAGSREIANLILKGYKYYDVESQVLPILREIFRVEFLNRFDKVIMFRPLLKHEVEEIADLMMKKIDENLKLRGMDINWDKQTLEELAEKGYNSIYGAREMRRVVQEEIEDRIANKIIEGAFAPGKVLTFNGLNLNNIS
jgi:ATP-dependent Clp protease ATP-binding subunit ClpC